MRLDEQKTAMLTLDFQQGILARTARAVDGAIANAARAAEFGRTKKYLLIHVGLGFTEGHPEIPDRESPLLRAKQNNLFVKGSPSGEFHGSIARKGELAVYKQRYAAFSENDLQLILRARGIENLVFFGVSTSGIVLSTVRRAFDLDFRCVVLKDACFDADAEVHRVLTEKVFPVQAAVITVDEFIAQQGR